MVSIRMVSIHGKKGMRELIGNPNRSYRISYMEYTLPSIRRLEYPIHLPEDFTSDFKDRRDISYKPLFSASIENGHVIGYGNIISPDHFIIDDATPDYETARYHDKVSLLKGETTIGPPQYVDGRLFVMSAMYCDSYYHWLYHSIPKLKLVSGFQFDKIYANYGKKYQKEWLDLLGIPADTIIPANNDTHIKARELVFTSYLSILSDYAIASLREMAIKYGEKSKRDGQKIYISRNDTPSKRTLVNEHEVSSFLRTEGFEKYELTKLSVKDQIKLFSSASFVIGPHGAGIGNIVFCKEGTKVIEIFDPGYVHPCMWMQVPSLKLQYGYVIGDGEKDLNRSFLERLCKPITVNIEKFKTMYYELKKLPSC